MYYVSYTYQYDRNAVCMLSAFTVASAGADSSIQSFTLPLHDIFNTVQCFTLPLNITEEVKDYTLKFACCSPRSQALCCLEEGEPGLHYTAHGVCHICYGNHSNKMGVQSTAIVSSLL